MRLFSYRNRLKLRKLGIALLVIVLVLLVAAICFVAYMDRFIVYDENGAHIDFHVDEMMTAAPVIHKPAITPEINIVGEASVNLDEAAVDIKGYYITGAMLRDVAAVRAALEAGSYNAVLMDLKDVYGNFYYSSKLSDVETAASVDTAAVDALIAELRSEGVYLIARIPAFADQKYCLAHVELGLPLSSGALWVDSNNCYWMDPGDPAVLTRITDICAELRTLGFREVVLNNYYFPDSTNIVYDESEKTKGIVLGESLQTLQANTTAMGVTVSISIPTTMVAPTPISSGRLYFVLNSGAEISNVVGFHTPSVVTPEVQIAFLTESHDTRFEEYGVLTPLIENTTAQN